MKKFVSFTVDKPSREIMFPRKSILKVEQRSIGGVLKCCVVVKEDKKINEYLVNESISCIKIHLEQ